MYVEADLLREFNAKCHKNIINSLSFKCIDNKVEMTTTIGAIKNNGGFKPTTNSDVAHFVDCASVIDVFCVLPTAIGLRLPSFLRRAHSEAL